MHHISGWVRNDPRGTVSIFAQGEQEDMDRFLEAVNRGPSFSRVTDVRMTQAAERPELNSFQVYY
jgi:acylphosphatase